MDTDSIDFDELEQEFNETLEAAWQAIMSDVQRREHFASLFDRSSEEGFYRGDGPVKGQGEQPSWSPNRAYMDSLVEMWRECAGILQKYGLELDEPLETAFYSSREYRDTAEVHRRVFTGQLVSTSSQVPLTLFMLTVPHSHREFDYAEAPVVQVSRTLTLTS